MIRKMLMASLLVVLALSMSACAKKISDDDRVLIKVSNRFVTVGDFKAKIARMPAYYQSVVEKNKKRYMDELILEMLLYEEAVRQGVDRGKDIQEIINEAKKKIVIAKLIKNEVEDKVTVSEDEMKKFYELNKNQFKASEMWRASHILVSDESQARAIQDQLSKGANFEDLARSKSTDATASRGGDIGYFRLGQVVPDFEKACANLSVGQTSDVVHTQFGYHIIKLTDKKEGGIQSYEESKEVIDSSLRRKKRTELFNKLVASMKAKYNVEIKEDVLESLEKAAK
jgi:peptidyl-prolyl cis-trans isomerase C